ncbi:hypothetical protein KO02_15115 [Sphingobacterium sp. ML3W]|uniref:hypothetical protein n=1 Tax=Sphingobacterium sp. ML3W TaxID=1538644 RepID=UPI0004F8FDE5|nr:hypothetical protein [Sphingobacterium sp. ML3W]AIM37868.1 hypothetical protein KO02_15115 [Sphingobacterium sp. ML3W]
MFVLVWTALYNTDASGQVEPNEAKLVSQIMALDAAKSEAETDFANSAFVQSLQQQLILPKTFSFSFPRLSEYVKIVSSADDQIRFYSWQLPVDGSRRRIQVIAQFKTKKGKIVVQQLQYFGKSDEYTFAENGIYAVYPIKYANEMAYLTFGWGTYGQGIQHNVVSLYRIEKDSLVKALDGLPQQKEIMIQYPRNADCKLRYDVNSQELSYNSYILHKDKGYYYPDGNTIRLKLRETTGFVKQ